MKFGSPDGLSGSASKLRKTKCHDADLLGSTGKDLFGIVSPTSRYCPVPRDKRITINRWCEDNEDADLEGLRQGDPEAVPRGYELFQPDSEDEEDEGLPYLVHTDNLVINKRKRSGGMETVLTLYSHPGTHNSCPRTDSRRRDTCTLIHAYTP